MKDSRAILYSTGIVQYRSLGSATSVKTGESCESVEGDSSSDLS